MNLKRAWGKRRNHSTIIRVDNDFKDYLGDLTLKIRRGGRDCTQLETTRLLAHSLRRRDVKLKRALRDLEDALE